MKFKIANLDKNTHFVLWRQDIIGDSRPVALFTSIDEARFYVKFHRVEVHGYRDVDVTYRKGSLLRGANRVWIEGPAIEISLPVNPKWSGRCDKNEVEL